VVWTIPVFTPQPQSVTALRPVLIFHPAEGTGLSWPVANLQSMTTLSRIYCRHLLRKNLENRQAFGEVRASVAPLLDSVITGPFSRHPVEYMPCHRICRVIRDVFVLGSGSSRRRNAYDLHASTDACCLMSRSNCYQSELLISIQYSTASTFTRNRAETIQMRCDADKFD